LATGNNDNGQCDVTQWDIQTQWQP